MLLLLWRVSKTVEKPDSVYLINQKGTSLPTGNKSSFKSFPASWSTSSQYTTSVPIVLSKIVL